MTNHPKPDELPAEYESLAGPPIFSFSRQAIQSVDEAAVNEYGIPTLILMENAARSVAQEILALEAERNTEQDFARPALILCGKGNNGADGLALARHLANDGFAVQIILAFDPEKDSPAEAVQSHLKIANAMRIPVLSVDQKNPQPILDQLLEEVRLANAPIIIVDSLLGTGLAKPPRPPYDQLINWINQRGAQPDTSVVAIDLPSGLDCETGQPLGPDAVHAQLTVTFVGLKDGFLQPEAQPYIGDIAIGDIGAPFALSQQFGRPVTAADVFDATDSAEQ